MNILISEILTIAASLIFLSSAFGCFRSKDIFAKMQYIKNIGYYGFNLAVIAKAANSLDIAIFIKSAIIIIINIIFTMFLCRLVVGLAIKNKIEPDCKKISFVKTKKQEKKNK